MFFLVCRHHKHAGKLYVFLPDDSYWKCAGKEIKSTLASGENLYVRGFGSFIIKKRAAKIGRNIKKNIAVSIPEHFIPAFKPAKEFVQEIKSSPNVKEAPSIDDDQSA